MPTLALQLVVGTLVLNGEVEDTGPDNKKIHVPHFPPSDLYLLAGPEPTPHEVTEETTYIPRGENKFLTKNSNWRPQPHLHPLMPSNSF